jgi:hypothetical protein
MVQEQSVESLQTAAAGTIPAIASQALNASLQSSARAGHARVTHSAARSAWMMQVRARLATMRVDGYHHGAAPSPFAPLRGLRNPLRNSRNGARIARARGRGER